MNEFPGVHLAAQVATAVSALCGALWVTRNYLQTRVARLELHVHAKAVTRDGLQYLIVKNQLKNIGLSRVKVNCHASLVTVSAQQLPKRVGIVMEPRWKDLASFDLFGENYSLQWIEPNELLVGEQMIALPGVGETFLKVETQVVSGKVRWKTHTVVEPAKPADSGSERSSTVRSISA